MSPNQLANPTTSSNPITPSQGQEIEPPRRIVELPGPTVATNRPNGPGLRSALAGRYERAGTSWMVDALCQEPTYSTLNFTSKSPNEISKCIAVCGRCLVREECRRFADETEDVASVLGGEDPAARKARWRVRGRMTTSERSF